jgi:hypothetical protein
MALNLALGTVQLTNQIIKMTHTMKRPTKCFAPPAYETNLQAENERLRKLAANLTQRVAALRSEERRHPLPMFVRIDKIKPKYH